MSRIDTVVGPLYAEERGSGPAIFLWPSLFCDLRTLGPAADELARDHRVVLVDGPGHGRSGSSGRRFTFEESADAAMAVLDAKGIPRATFIGSAWGGHVGAVAAVRHPDRLDGLILCNAPMGAWEGSQRRTMWAGYTLLWLARSRRVARLFAEPMIAPEIRATHPERLEAVVDCICSSERAGFLLAVRSAMLDRPDLVPRLREIRVPTLVLTGDLDELFPVDLARQQAAAIPGSRFHVVEGTSHLSLWEAPERALVPVREFLAEHRAAG